jgi:hypothetical protein
VAAAHRLCNTDRASAVLAPNIDVAPQDDRPGSLVVGDAELAIEVDLSSGLLPGEASQRPSMRGLSSRSGEPFCKRWRGRAPDSPSNRTQSWLRGAWGVDLTDLLSEPRSIANPFHPR